MQICRKQITDYTITREFYIWTTGNYPSTIQEISSLVDKDCAKQSRNSQDHLRYHLTAAHSLESTYYLRMMRCVFNEEPYDHRFFFFGSFQLVQNIEQVHFHMALLYACGSKASKSGEVLR